MRYTVKIWKEIYGYLPYAYNPKEVLLIKEDIFHLKNILKFYKKHNAGLDNVEILTVNGLIELYEKSNMLNENEE